MLVAAAVVLIGVALLQFFTHFVHYLFLIVLLVPHVGGLTSWFSDVDLCLGWLQVRTSHVRLCPCLLLQAKTRRRVDRRLVDWIYHSKFTAASILANSLHCLEIACRSPTDPRFWILHVAWRKFLLLPTFANSFICQVFFVGGDRDRI